MEQLDIAGDVIFNTVKVAELKMRIGYLFNLDRYKKKDIKKAELREIAARLYKEYLATDTFWIIPEKAI